MKKIVASNGSYIESASVTYSPDSFAVCTSCLICGESVPVYGNRPEPKICDDCKRAVLAMRKALET